MAFKMKGFSGFMSEGPKKTESIVQNYGKKPKEDPTFEYGHEESEKIMKLKREGLVPGPKMREKAGAPKKVKHKDLEKVVDELKGAVKAHGRQAKTIDKHIDDMAGMPKKVSWKYGDGTYSGDLIPSMETSTHRYARTHNGKIKSLPKNK